MTGLIEQDRWRSSLEATAGIGARMAKRFVEEGAYVVVFGTNTGKRRTGTVAEISKLMPDAAAALFNKSMWPTLKKLRQR